MLFNYKAKNLKGETLEGIVEASSEKSAADILSEKEFVVISLVLRKEGFVDTKKLNPLKFFGGVKERDLVVFSRQLSVMIASTVPIVQALRILFQQTQSKALKSIISAMADDVDGGMKFSEALSHHPDVFTDFFISMVRAGESSGKMDETLNYLADQQERDHEVVSKVRGAMMYPAFIICAMVVVSIIMMVYVIPQLTGMLVESGVALPLPTRILLGTSSFLQSYWWTLPIMLIAVLYAFRAYVGTPSGRLAIDKLKINLPIFGKFFSNLALVRFTRSLSTLMTGGVPLAQALEIVANVVGNAVWKKMLLDTTTAVREGYTISSQVLYNKNFPTTVANMINVGEQTGRLEEILQTLTNFYTKETDTLIDGLLKLIEPMLMVVMGLAVGGMVAAIMLPMFSLINAGG